MPVNKTIFITSGQVLAAFIDKCLEGSKMKIARIYTENKGHDCTTTSSSILNANKIALAAAASSTKKFTVSRNTASSMALSPFPAYLHVL